MTREEEIYKGTQVFVGGYLDGLYDAETLAKRCAQWADEHPKNPWISVEERLPETNKNTRLSEIVIVRYAENQYECSLARFSNLAAHRHCFVSPMFNNPKAYPTHWMPIPELLKGGE